MGGATSASEAENKELTMSVNSVQNGPSSSSQVKEDREKWNFFFAIVRTIAAVISLGIAIVWAFGSGFAPLP
jgi:hypothetical protein